MDKLLGWKEHLQRLYGMYANYVTKILQFILGLLVFGLINENVGFMKLASSFVCTIGLAAVCAFLPLIVMTFAASVLILLHFYTLSLPIALVAALIFLMMYAFYFRFTPQRAWLVLLTPIAFALKVPYVIPVAFGLIGAPVYAVPMVCGTVVYYMLHYVKNSSAALKEGGVANIVGNLTNFAKQVFQNKEMLVMAAAIVISLLLVYTIRRKSADHAWKIAIGAGVITSIIIVVVGNISVGLHISYVSLILGNLLAVVIGLALEFVLFSVDYSRTERMQFEDDEYYYYVKAVPKILISAPEMTVKHINERQETTTLGTGEESREASRLQARRRKPSEDWDPERADEELLAKSLHKELGIEQPGRRK